MTDLTVILAGAGHAHLYIASQASEYRQRGVRLILIDPGFFWYSGLATGMLSGMYSAEEDQIDARALIESSGGEFIQDIVTAVDPIQRVISLAGGNKLVYDWLSLNVGSQVIATDLVNPADVSCWPVKPIENLHRLRETLTAAIKQTGRMPSVCVIGGGITGCEIAANLLGLGELCQVKAAVTLVSDKDRLLPSAPPAAAKSLRSHLEKRGAQLLLGQYVTGTRPGLIVTRGDMAIKTDHVVLATGLEAKPLTRDIGVAANRQGIKVNCHMQSVDNPALFAAGDCSDFQPRPLPKLGVFGVRAAEIIHHNLLASIDGRPLKAFKPQKVWLAIMNLGNGEGLALWWRFWWHGRLSQKLKDRIDREFLQRYRRIYRS